MKCKFELAMKMDGGILYVSLQGWSW